MTKERIWLSPPHMSGREQHYVARAFEENWVAPLGPNVNLLEEKLCDFIGTKGAACLASGTAAIHLGLIIVGVKAGDRVLVSDFTFSASANPVVYLGAEPVFVGSEPDTWNLSPDALEQAIEASLKQGKKPSALVLVHLYGMPAKMREIEEICARHQIPIVEDAAEALGSAYFDKKLGSFGEVGVVSFNGNKIITSSGGGALLSNKPEHCERAIFLSTQARDPAPHYQHSEIGYNYRMSNIVAGIGCGQMEVLESYIEKRRENYCRYREMLSEVEEIHFVEEPEGFFSNRWLTTILFETAAVKPAKVIDALAQDNIETRPLWKPMHLQPVFQHCDYFGNKVEEDLFARGLCLPSGSSMSKEDQERVVERLLSVLK